MTRRPISYSSDELAFLEERKAMPRRELHAEFVATFGRDDVSFEHLQSLMKRRGWPTGRTGAFEKGSTPTNKGKKMLFNARSAATQFKKGQLPHTYRAPGHERFCERTGYVILIVAEKNPWKGSDTRPVLKHKWLWERENGPVPDGMCLKCMDGDRGNTAPSNWMPLPRGLVPRLSLKRGSEDAPEELKPVLLTLARIEHAVDSRMKKGGD